MSQQQSDHKATVQDIKWQRPSDGKGGFPVMAETTRKLAASTR